MHRNQGNRPSPDRVGLLQYQAARCPKRMKGLLVLVQVLQPEKLRIAIW